MNIEERKLVLGMSKDIMNLMVKFDQLSEDAKDSVFDEIFDIVTPQELITLSSKLTNLAIPEEVETPEKHKNINLTEFKNMFPSYKITRKILQQYINESYPNPLILEEIEIKIYNHGKGIFADFVKDNYINHLSC